MKNDCLLKESMTTKFGKISRERGTITDWAVVICSLGIFGVVRTTETIDQKNSPHELSESEPLQKIQRRLCWNLWGQYNWHKTQLTT